MRIGIDISQIAYEGTGVSRFTDGLVKAILSYDKKNEWIFFFSSLRNNLETDLERKIKDNGYKLIKWKLPPSLLSFLWNDLHYFSELFTIHYSLFTSLDWFITSDWTEPPLQDVKKATVVHDLVYIRYPETVHETIRKTQEKRLNWVKKESRLIFSDSAATKKDLIELLDIPGKNIVVNYPGIEIARSSKNQIQETLKKYNLDGRQFILTVGKLEPRKNLERLLEAMKQVKNQGLQLIVVGPEGWSFDLTQDKRLKNVKFLGLIRDEELYSLYSSCLFFIFPSLWEGFGYPIIEAMKLGAPVSCSNTSSVKEIAGDAAVLFDPHNTQMITQCINELSRDESLRKKLIKEGLERSKLFTWERYYNTLIEGLESVK